MNKAQFLKAGELERKTVTLEGGEKICIRDLSGRERDYMRKLYHDAELANPDEPEALYRLPEFWREELTIRGLIDEKTGLNMFGPDDLAEVSKLSEDLLTRVADAVIGFSLMGAEAEAEQAKK